MAAAKTRKPKFIEPELILDRLPPLTLQRQFLKKRIEKTPKGQRFLMERTIREDELFKAGANRKQAAEIAWREMQIKCWQQSLLTWPTQVATTQLIQDIQFGLLTPLKLTLDQDKIVYAQIEAERREAEEQAARDVKGDASASIAPKSLTEALAGHRHDVEEITLQLKAGAGRQASYLDCVQWVADHIDNPDAMPVDAPSNAAYSMLLTAREDRKSFYSGMRQTMKELESDKSESLTDPRYRELDGVLNKFADYHRYEMELSLLRDLLPFVQRTLGGVPVVLDEETKTLLSRVVEVAA